jgi:hypothetical protein
MIEIHIVPVGPSPLASGFIRLLAHVRHLLDATNLLDLLDMRLFFDYENPMPGRFELRNPVFQEQNAKRNIVGAMREKESI